MDSNIVVAIVSASSAVIVAIAALVINVVWMGRTFAQLDKRLSERLDKVEHTLEVIQADLKTFYKDIAQLKARTGLE